MPPIKLFNTLSRSVENFVPSMPGKASVYACGPTVYHFAHIGNLRTYIFEDVLTRLLRKMDYDVNHVMNITDVGHLQSDADSGDDKMAVASKRESKTVWEVAQFYENAFFRNCEQLNVVRPNIVCKATDHISEIIEFVADLENKGYTYQVDGNVYFDVEKFPTYRDFAKLASIDIHTESRVDVDSRKKDQRDFVLWFSQSKFPNQIMQWESPWGMGFPGWHIECSTMAMKYLGSEIDIHCGGIDHIPVHHTNEIAQSEARIGNQWVRYWLHGEFLQVDKEKMSKSSGDFLTLDKLIEAGFEPVHYRFFCLNAHYRNPLTFSYELLDATRKDFESIKCRIIGWEYETESDKPIATGSVSELDIAENYRMEFWNAIANDLNTKAAMTVFRNVVKDKILSTGEKKKLLLDFDCVLGLNVANFVRHQLTSEQSQLLQTRIEARHQKDFSTSDRIRDEFLQQGIILNDEKDGSVQWYLARRKIDTQPILPADISLGDNTSKSQTFFTENKTTSYESSPKNFEGRLSPYINNALFSPASANSLGIVLTADAYGDDVIISGDFGDHSRRPEAAKLENRLSPYVDKALFAPVLVPANSQGIMPTADAYGNDVITSGDFGDHSKGTGSTLK